ncbi:unnamed protein product [Owenia fusiformis]|uniref:Chitin-binding type-2 domain-containing protein n=1 Tax=Owenia fusiformis TaxID=6347 RepID=A0A8S4PLD5_OWEFU|nr:unnamed protein product [Owenia fusiformis]
MANCTLFSNLILSSDDKCTNVTRMQGASEMTGNRNLLAPTLQIAIAVIIFFVNLLVVASIKRYKKLQTVSNIFRGHLAMNDSIFGALLALRGILELSGTLSKTMPCIIINVFVNSSAGVTMSGVLLLWIEMFLATKRKCINGAFSRKTAFALIVVTVALWLVYCISFTLFHKNKRIDKACHLGNGLIHENHLIGVCIIMFLHLIVLLILQCLTFWNLHKHVAHLKEHGVVPQNSKRYFRTNIRHIRVSPFNIDQNLKTDNPKTLEKSASGFCRQTLQSPDPNIGYSNSTSEFNGKNPPLLGPTPGCSSSNNEFDGQNPRLPDPTPGCSSSNYEFDDQNPGLPDSTPGRSSSNNEFHGRNIRLRDPTPGCSSSNYEFDDQNPGLPDSTPGRSSSNNEFHGRNLRLRDPTPGCSSSNYEFDDQNPGLPDSTPGRSSSNNEFHGRNLRLRDPTPRCFSSNNASNVLNLRLWVKVKLEKVNKRDKIAYSILTRYQFQLKTLRKLPFVRHDGERGVHYKNKFKIKIMASSNFFTIFAIASSLFIGAWCDQCDCAVDPDNTLCESGCTYYIYCFNGTEETLQCPSGQVLDVETGTCDVPEKVEPPCGVYHDCTGKEDGYYANEYDNCLSYHYCVDGQFQANNLCPTGLVFDDPRGVCNWQYNVCPPCGDGTGDVYEPCPTTTTTTTTVQPTTGLP